MGIPTNLPRAKAVTVWAAAPTETPKCVVSTGSVGRIIAQAKPDSKVVL
jgi:hypothetical protein